MSDATQPNAGPIADGSGDLSIFSRDRAEIEKRCQTRRFLLVWRQ